MAFCVDRFLILTCMDSCCYLIYPHPLQQPSVSTVGREVGVESLLGINVWAVQVQYRGFRLLVKMKSAKFRVHSFPEKSNI